MKHGDLEAMLERAKEAFADLVRGKRFSPPFVRPVGWRSRWPPTASRGTGLD
jgi:hypothetical protein